MPPAATGPGPFRPPPFAETPLTVVNTRAVSNSQTTWPSVLEYARITPSTVPEKTAPGTTVTAADWAGMHRRSGAHVGLTLHTSAPSARLTAEMPPACG